MTSVPTDQVSVETRCIDHFIVRGLLSNNRPGNHREFLEYVRDTSEKVGIKDFALENPRSAAVYLKALDQVRDFRWRHWCFTKEYILRHTKHKTATGGSPIVTVSSSLPWITPITYILQWLPNQLQAVLDQMQEVEGSCQQSADVQRIMALVDLQSSTLKKDVAKYCEERDI